MFMDYKQMPMSELLKDRAVYSIFDDEFSKGTWLDVTGLVRSDATLMDLYNDGTVPGQVLDNIIDRLRRKL